MKVDDISNVVEEFLNWCSSNRVHLAGPVQDPLLGTHVLCALHEDDEEVVVRDFANFYYRNHKWDH